MTIGAKGELRSLSGRLLMAWLLAAALSPAGASLVGEWRFDEASNRMRATGLQARARDEHDAVSDWTNVQTVAVGGAQDLPGAWARQSSVGVLGPPQPIVGGLVNEYTLVTVRGDYLRLELQAFNADGSYIGVLDWFEIGTDPGPDTDGDGMRDAWERANPAHGFVRIEVVPNP